MVFRTIDSIEPVVEYVTGVLNAQLLAGKRVLWLVAGGSSVPVSVGCSKRLLSVGVPLDKLVVSLTDERYGDVGHANSNWRELEEAGFALPGATLHPVLSGKDMAGTVADFESFLEAELSQATFSIGLFGIGPDGHTSGILPHTSAVRETKLVHGYDAGAFQRVTTTPAAIARLDEAVSYAVGEAKWPVLDQLETALSPDDQPAQVLKSVPKLTIFTDRRKD